MTEPTSSERSLGGLPRIATAFAGACYGVLGVVMFVAPAWAADEFPWAITEFVARTIGGWAIGTAWVAWVAVRRWDWGLNHGCMLFLWVFPVSELAVVLYHEESVVLDRALSWPYLVTLGAGTLAAVLGTGAWLVRRPAIPPLGPPPGRSVHVFAWTFVGFLALLVLATLRAGESAVNGRVFPEPITPFTVRAFGVFYLSLAVGALPFTRARGMDPVITYGIAGEGLVIAITAAAFFHLDLFDLGDHPLNALYLAAYLVVGVVTAYGLVTRRSPG